VVIMGERQAEPRLSVVALMTVTGVVLLGGVVVGALPGSRTEAMSVPAVPSAGTDLEDADLARDTQICLAVSGIVEDASVGAQDRTRGSVVAALHTAERRLDEQGEAVDPRVLVAVRNMREAITGLRAAIGSGTAVARATHVVLDRIDDLDAACRTRLAPSAASPV
jgi:hypothetical protein